MKFINKLLLTAAVIGAGLASVPVRAQNLDTFAQPRSIVLTPPALLGPSVATVTNGPIDVRGFLGTVVVDVNSLTNAGGALTVQLFTSNDQTNQVAVSNYAAITASTSYLYTNRYNGFALFATNQWLIPGTITSPTAATSSFVGPYLDPTTVPFTNSGALTISARGVYRIGLRAQDLRSYLYAVYVPTGANTNDFVSAVLTGLKQSEVQTSQ